MKEIIYFKDGKLRKDTKVDFASIVGLILNTDDNLDWITVGSNYQRLVSNKNNILVSNDNLEYAIAVAQLMSDVYSTSKYVRSYESFVEIVKNDYWFEYGPNRFMKMNWWFGIKDKDTDMTETEFLVKIGYYI